MGKFKGIRKLSQAKYDELKSQGLLDPDIQYVTPTEPYLKKTDVVNNLTSENVDKPLSAMQGKVLNDMINSLSTEVSENMGDIADMQGEIATLAGQNEYIGSYEGTGYTASTIQTILSNFVQTTEGRPARNGDIVNIVNDGSDANYGGQQWIYVGENAQWKYYIDFENHSVINNLTSTSTIDGLSANQGRILNETINTLSDETADNMADISDIKIALPKKQDNIEYTTESIIEGGELTPDTYYATPDEEEGLDKANVDASNLTENNVTSWREKLNVSKTENIEIIYDSSSSDPNINWGYTSGYDSQSTINHDFSKYKALICTYIRQGGYGCQCLVDLTKITRDTASTQYKYNYNNGFTYVEGTSYYMQNISIRIPEDKMSLNFQSSQNGSIRSNQDQLIKIIGVY